MRVCCEWAHLSYLENPGGKLRKIWGQPCSQAFSSVMRPMTWCLSLFGQPEQGTTGWVA